MSQYIAFFAAPNDRKAKTAHARGPKANVRRVPGTFFEADDAVTLWERLLTGQVSKAD